MAREGALQIFETVKTMMEDKAQGNLLGGIDNCSGAALKGVILLLTIGLVTIFFFI